MDEENGIVKLVSRVELIVIVTSLRLSQLYLIVLETEMVVSVPAANNILLFCFIFVGVYSTSSNTGVYFDYYCIYNLQVSKEGDVHEVPINVAKMSSLILSTLDDDEEDDDDDEETKKHLEIPLPNVKNAVLTKVIEYCKHYTNDEAMTQIQTPLKSSKIEDLVQTWYAGFVDVEQTLLFELVTAANFMDIKPLLDLTCLAVSISIKGKTAPQLREIFNISNDFSQEEEAQVREESQWSQEDTPAVPAAAAAAAANEEEKEE